MNQKLIECIPNFSEGRRPEVVEAIVSAIKTIPGVVVLNYSSDPDHNRSVVTFVGEANAVEKAAFAAIRTAAALIDMDVHQGTHPRVGATDVVPFVPLGGSTLDECVTLAQALGRRVGEELSIPVYLYEEAATRPERSRLEMVRRGEYEALKTAIDHDADRSPDFGPRRLGKAGATIIGARQPLVAFNVFLTTADVHVARKIARSIRASSGGFPYVKALGMLVGGRAQVSMNFSDLAETSLGPVVEAIRNEAAELGVSIHHTELIGLVSNSVLVDVARWYLQLEQLGEEQILEYQLAKLVDNNNSILE